MFGSSTEQMASALKDMSIMAMGYYKDLLAQGFTEEQAFTLVVEWQKAITGGNK